MLPLTFSDIILWTDCVLPYKNYPEERVMKHMSFRLKLTLAFIVTALIEGALIGGLSYCHSRDIVVKNKKH